MCSYPHSSEDLKGNRENPEKPAKVPFNALLREQAELRQSIRQRCELSEKMSEVDYEQSRMSTSCMIDRYFTQMFCANVNGQEGEDQYTSCSLRFYE